MAPRGGRSLKHTYRWFSPNVEREVQLVRWGTYGVPVLLFPTAGGDAEEVERFHLIGVLMPLIESGRIKVYSTDSIAGQAWISRQHSAEYCSLLQNRFDKLVIDEIVPRIREDCQSPDIEIITAGASIGAFNAVASICRHPDVFRLAIAMSGTYDLSKYLEGRFIQDFYFASPLHFLPGLEGPVLEQLRKRLILLPSGEGDFEDIGESWRMGNALGAKRIPNRVDPWGTEWRHDWVTWREMLPKYLSEFADWKPR
jgi:esterase/lipase superfamily enzyme